MMTFPYPPQVPESKPEPELFSSDTQLYLVGETIFLREVEREDARRSTGWHDSPYPINPERAEEIIRKHYENHRPGRGMLVACRRDTGVPVGSLTWDIWPGTGLITELDLYADPALPNADAIKAEMLKLYLEWGFGERDLASVYLEFDDDQATLRSAAESAGMRRGAMWRDGVWRDGAWRNRVAYQGYNPIWLKQLGDPGAGIDFAVAVDDPQRWRPRQFPLYGRIDGDLPANAVRVGPRVYLRPLEMDDAAVVARYARREPDASWKSGRTPISAAGMTEHIRSVGKGDPPEWVRFAICDGETGECVGTNGLAGLDLINRRAETETVMHHPGYRGKGYGSEAKHLLLDYGFNTLGLHSVYSWVWGPNTRSAAALRKQGYRDAGRAFWEGARQGEQTWACLFDFLADEWREMTARSSAEAATAAR